MVTATPTIVTAGATAAGMRRARSSRISIVAADAGLGGDTVAIRPATIAVGPAASPSFHTSETQRPSVGRGGGRPRRR
jgi:hypothetical protein